MQSSNAEMKVQSTKNIKKGKKSEQQKENIILYFKK